MNRRALAAAVVTLLLTPAAASDVGDLPASRARLTAALQAIVEDDGAQGVAALVYRNGRLVHQEVAGEIDIDEPLPVASASKWVAAALVMTFVDKGRLSLDEPIGLRMATGAPEAGQITLRQMLSYTTGQGSIESFADLTQPPDISLADSAARILGRPLEDPPGTVFKYGSGAMQIAGALVEQITGQHWEEIFQERLAGPLGMTRSWWTHPLHPNIDPDAVTNPIIQAGLMTTAADYGRFLTMLANGGVFGGSRILSERAVEQMETLQTADVELTYCPPGCAGWSPYEGEPRPGISPSEPRGGGISAGGHLYAVDGYALGNWCERADHFGRCLLVSSPGALGTWPWIDRQNDIYGIFVMRHRFPRVRENLFAAREVILNDFRRILQVDQQ
ncbi:serine hydrolase domain-containing protein [Chelativorans sp. AA-79]|uniref:serine hydrolase domain-containing protein n=1 Tax=Chelativorans sp. AA-79 TaxID=3028735 RepID=UPI0023F64533|nr:serine hydrolase domain-containing protein [Chelativorans sp. AA-79]WEX07978.1 serine hydrolase [Chelativorans sp. AA-79]